MKNLRFGYMPSFTVDLISEIKFARKYFDFIEITLKLNLTEYTKEYLKRLRQILDNFEILGHIHWELELTSKQDLQTIIKNIEIYKLLGSKKITIHPSFSDSKDQKQVKLKNLKILKYLSNLCQKNRIQLLVENSTSPPFNTTEGFKYLLTKNLSLSLTLDIGHANSISKTELDHYLSLFSRKIKHIHLHYNYGKFDHLLFPKKQKRSLNRILTKLSKLNTKLTVNLEMFAVLRKQKPFLINGKLRQRLLLNQLRLLKNKFICHIK